MLAGQSGLNIILGLTHEDVEAVMKDDGLLIFNITRDNGEKFEISIYTGRNDDHLVSLISGMYIIDKDTHLIDKRKKNP